ncbi:MAG: hypothetical protein QXS54_05210 [Candidatus Methanomethylicaceae archaeon]
MKARIIKMAGIIKMPPRHPPQCIRRRNEKAKVKAKEGNIKVMDKVKAGRALIRGAGNEFSDRIKTRLSNCARNIAISGGPIDAMNDSTNCARNYLMNYTML